MYHLLLAATLHPFAYNGETFNARGGEYSAVPVVSELLVRRVVPTASMALTRAGVRASPIGLGAGRPQDPAAVSGRSDQDACAPACLCALAARQCTWHQVVSVKVPPSARPLIPRRGYRRAGMRTTRCCARRWSSTLRFLKRTACGCWPTCTSRSRTFCSCFPTLCRPRHAQRPTARAHSSTPTNSPAHPAHVPLVPVGDLPGRRRRRQQRRVRPRIRTRTARHTTRGGSGRLWTWSRSVRPPRPRPAAVAACALAAGGGMHSRQLRRPRCCHNASCSPPRPSTATEPPAPRAPTKVRVRCVMRGRQTTLGSPLAVPAADQLGGGRTAAAQGRHCGRRPR
jgi:hypothetical protein